MKLSLLLAARKDSQFMAKFLLSFMTKTKDFRNVELLILTPQGEWNKDLFYYFRDHIKVYDDTTGLGRGGSHVFYQELAKYATGDWMWYLCDDHMLLDGYDEYIAGYIQEQNLNPDKIQVIAPFVDNSGRITHILSRKFVETIGFAPQGNVDSCVNETLEHLEKLIGVERMKKVLYLPLQPVIHDFSMDHLTFKPQPFDSAYEIALFKSQGIKDKLKDNAYKLSTIINTTL